MSEKITDQQITAYKEAFSLFDSDNDGYLTSVELGTTLRALGHPLSEHDVETLIQEVGTDQAETIDFPEFLAMMSRRKIPADSQADVREAFGVFDADGSGQISAAELRRVLVSAGDKLSVAEADALIKEVDLNGNGTISLDEFAKVLCQGK